MSYYRSGLGNAASYQVSGKPFTLGSLSINTITGADPIMKIDFPSVTRWVMIINHDNTALSKQRPLRIGFSELGLPSNGGTNYFTIWDGSTTFTYWQLPRLEIKVTELYIEGRSSKFDIIAGLTGIETLEIENNWSGSAGVG